MIRVYVYGVHQEQLLEKNNNNNERRRRKTYEWIEPGTMRDCRPLLITTMFGQLINMISWLRSVCHRVHGSSASCGKIY